MNFRNLTNAELSAKIAITVAEERRLTAEVLHLLREVERREIFAEMGFSSLFIYCVEHLKYSESAAQRRIVAMRALREMPELEEKLESGTLSLSVLAMTQSSLRKAKVSLERKRQVFREVEGLSRRKAEEVLVQKFELPVSGGSERAMPDGGVRVTLEFSAEEMAEFEELRRLKSEAVSTKDLVMSLVRAEVAKRKRALGEAPLLKKSTSAGGSNDSSYEKLASLNPAC